MNVKEAIERRRAYRSLDPVEITNNLIVDLAQSAQLAPSCFNKQPWRYIFIYHPEMLTKMYGTLSKGNEWVTDASMIIAVFSKENFDCQIKGRNYYLFDAGIATAFLILRATELGLVAHPIAGYNEAKAKEILGIPEDMRLITLVNIGEKSDKISVKLSGHQITAEKERPERLPFDKFIYHNRYHAEEN